MLLIAVSSVLALNVPRSRGLGMQSAGWGAGGELLIERNK